VKAKVALAFLDVHDRIRIIQRERREKVSEGRGEKFEEKKYEVDGLYHGLSDWLYANLDEEVLLDAHDLLDNLLIEVLNRLRDVYPQKQEVRRNFRLVK